jgi:transposase-like protein
MCQHRPQAAPPPDTAGDLELRIPQVRAGSFSPSLLACRRRIDQALSVVVMNVHLRGVSARKVDYLVRAPAPAPRRHRHHTADQHGED